MGHTTHPIETKGLLPFFAVATASAVAWLYLPYFLGQKTFLHDSLVPATLIGLFYDRTFGGDGWLWSTALNGGHPIWVSLETAPLLDPVVVTIYSLATALDSPWLPPYHLTAFVWLLAFAAGGALCAREITGSFAAAVLVFVLLMCGPVVLTVPAASNGFLVPFRYFGLTLWLYLRMRRTSSLASTLGFSTVLSVSFAGYLTVYPFVMLMTLFIAELVVGRLRFVNWLRRFVSARNVALLLIPAFAISPTLVWLMYTADLIAIPHQYRHGNVFFFSFDEFASGLLLTYLMVAEGRSVSVYHGSTFIGLLALPFLFFGLWRSLGVLARGNNEDPASYWLGVLVVWLVLVVVLCCGFFGLREFVESEGAFLKVRNFGFLLSGVFFLMALVVGCGFSEVVEGRYRWHDMAINTAAFAGLTMAAIWLSVLDDVDTVTALLFIGAFGLVNLLWWRLSAWLPPQLFTFLIVAVVSIELFVFVSAENFLPSLESTATRLENEDASDLARSRMVHLGSHREDLPQRRQFKFETGDHWPFHLEGPAVSDVAVAYSEPVVSTPLGVFGLAVSHLFRLKSYDRLVNGALPDPDLQQVLGVTRPVLELVPENAVSEDDEGLTLVLRHGPNVQREPSAASPGQITTIDYRGDRLRLTVDNTTSEQAVLVYRDNMAPGWRASVDGTDVELLVVDRVNKAVAVPPGQHRVEFVYRPWPYLVAFALRAVVLIGALAACAWLAVRACRMPKAT